MTLLIVNQSSVPAPRKFIHDWGNKVFQRLQKKKILSTKPGRTLTVVFLNQVAAKKMNRQFRGKDYATDILSFDSMESDSLGELVLCPQVLKKQAKEHGLSYRDELGYMILHGVLHLLGYDHETNEKDAREMFRIQDEVFEEIRPSTKLIARFAVAAKPGS